MQNKNLITNGYHIPYNPKLKERSRELRNNMTEPEKKLWYEFLKGLKETFLRQKPIANYIVDFYCARNKLVIEIDGDSHFSEEGETYDKERTAILEDYGLHVLRFTNRDVMENFANVCENIVEKLRKSP
jgi:very-short-patch-repair endonuclease